MFNYLADNQNIYNFICPHDYLIYHKAWHRSDEHWRSIVLKFMLGWGPMLTETKKIRNI